MTIFTHIQMQKKILDFKFCKLAFEKHPVFRFCTWDKQINRWINLPVLFTWFTNKSNEMYALSLLCLPAAASLQALSCKVAWLPWPSLGFGHPPHTLTWRISIAFEPHLHRQLLQATVCRLFCSSVREINTFRCKTQ